MKIYDEFDVMAMLSPKGLAVLITLTLIFSVGIVSIVEMLVEAFCPSPVNFVEYMLALGLVWGLSMTESLSWLTYWANILENVIDTNYIEK